jgi:uncharacterized membrane protein
MQTHNHHDTSAPGTRAQRRQQFDPAQRPARRFSPTTLVLAVSGLLLAIAVVVIASSGQESDERVWTAIGGAGVDVVLPVRTFDDGVARFYKSMTEQGREVRFFIMKSADGVVRAAFDACDTCYRDRLGYHQRGDLMVCNKCQQTFRSVDINVLQGGCNPAPLDRRVVGNQLVLDAASIEQGAAYF